MMWYFILTRALCVVVVCFLYIGEELIPYCADESFYLHPIYELVRQHCWEALFYTLLSDLEAVFA